MRLPALPDRWRALLAVAACLLLAGGIALAGMHAGWPVQWTLLASLAPWLLLAGLVWRFFSRDAATRRALLALIAGYRDGDYSHGLAPTRNDMADLVEAHNALGNTLREQRLARGGAAEEPEGLGFGQDGPLKNFCNRWILGVRVAALPPFCHFAL